MTLAPFWFAILAIEHPPHDAIRADMARFPSSSTVCGVLQAVSRRQEELQHFRVFYPADEFAIRREILDLRRRWCAWDTLGDAHRAHGWARWALLERLRAELGEDYELGRMPEVPR